MPEGFDGERCRELLEAIWENDRFGDFRHFRATAAWVEGFLREAGLSEVESLPLRADGRTRYLDWTIPRAWDLSDAGLTLLSEGGPEPLCSYAQTPLCAAMFSAPLPRGEYLIVDASAADWRGRVVYTAEAPKALVREALGRGAAALVSDFFPDYPGAREVDDLLEGACRWENDLFYPRNDTPLAAFSLSRSAGARLRERLRREGSLRAEAWVEARSYDGEIRTVSGLLPGVGTDEEILLCAHLYEPGANDNASGCALLCHLAERLRAEGRTGPRRGVRLVMGYEAAGMSGYLAAHPERAARTAAALNCDMVGAAPAEKAVLHVWNAPMTNGTFAYSLLTGLARRMAIPFQESPFDIGDCLMADPAVGVPCCSLVMHPANSYHSSLDTPRRVSAKTLAENGTLVREWVRILAAPTGGDIAFARACLQEEYGRILRAPDGPLALRLEQHEQALASFERWAYRDALSRVPRRLVPGAATLGGRLRREDPRVDPFYDLLLNTALFHADGSRTLRTIIRRACAETGREGDPEAAGRIARFFDEAAKNGVVSFDGEGGAE